MTAAEIIAELRPLGKTSYKKVLLNHGIPEPMFGVSVAELKKIQKRIKKDYQLALRKLLQRVERTIHAAPNGVRYAMNSFVIAVGSYVKPLSDMALKTAERIGPVTVEMGITACKVPYAPDYIRKVKARGTIGK